MVTQQNDRKPVTYDGVTYEGRGNTCTTRVLGTGHNAGYNSIYKAKSELIRNPKDAYGFRPMSPFEGVEQELKQPVGVTGMYASYAYQAACGQLWYRQSGGLPGGIESLFREQVNREHVAGAQTHDLLAMRAEAGLRQQDINVLQFAAFLPATLKNIASNLKKMDHLLDLLHNPKKLKKFLGKEDPRSLYLQWLFVWNQLYRDVVGGARFLRSKARPIGSLVTGRAQNTAEDVETTQRVATGGWFPMGTATCDTRVHLSQRAVSVARISCDIEFGRNALGLDNPAYLAWDLVKWSWVVDQIVDIGLFISSLTSLHGLEFLGTSITDRVVNESIVTVDLPPKHVNAQVWYEQQNWSPGFSRRKSVNRVVRKSQTNTITIRNPFQNSVMITAAVAAAVSMKAGKSKDMLARLPR